jgi:hypothetical protein
MDWHAFWHGFGMLITLVSGLLSLAALFIRNNDEQED